VGDDADANIESSSAKPRDDACDSVLIHELSLFTEMLAVSSAGDCNFENNASSDELALIGG
jgi:hypothetical protein